MARNALIAPLERRAGKAFFWRQRVLKEKLKIFLSKHAASDRFFLARLFFRRKKTVPKKVAIIYEHVLINYLEDVLIAEITFRFSSKVRDAMRINCP